MSGFFWRGSASLLAQSDSQRFLDLDPAVTFNEAEPPKFVHEEIHSRTRGSNHRRQGFLGDFREGRICLWILLPRTSEQQKRSGEALLTRIDELIDQVRFHLNVALDHLFDEVIV